MVGKPTRVLLIEDRQLEMCRIRDMLAEVRDAQFTVEGADRLSAGLERLADGGIDIVLLDLALPDSEGLDTVLEVHKRAPEAPIVVLTGLEDEALTVEALRAGAQDYLPKSQLNGDLLARSIRYAMERHQVWQKLRERTQLLEASERHLRGIVNQNADGILIVDKEGIVRFANPAGETLFRLTGEELLGQPFGFPVIAGETTELDILRKGGDTAVAEMRVVEISWDREPVYLASLHDITERKRLERMKDQLISSVSHNLRTPLHAMVGYLDLLYDGAYGDLPGEQREAILTLAKVTKEMTGMINALLDLSKMKSGRYQLSIRPLDLKDLVDEVLEELRFLAENKGLTLSKQFTRDSFPMKSDRRTLWQILSNLVGNALKFTDHGSVKVSVDSVAGNPGSEEGVVKIRVEDTGCGIKAQHIERIFDEFYQTEEPGNDTTAGSGLGLAICRRLVELLGGKITVESEVGKGSIFSVKLPQDAGLVTDQPGGNAD